jgi:hypothetical protein
LGGCDREDHSSRSVRQKKVLKTPSQPIVDVVCLPPQATQKALKIMIPEGKKKKERKCL